MKQKKTKARRKMDGRGGFLETKERGGGTIVVWIKRRDDRVLRKFRTTRTDESLIEWQKGSRGSWPLTFHCDFAGPVWAHRGLVAGFARFLAFFFCQLRRYRRITSLYDHGILKCKILITGNEKGRFEILGLIGVSSYFFFLIFIVDFFVWRVRENELINCCEDIMWFVIVLIFDDIAHVECICGICIFEKGKNWFLLYNWD